MTLILKKTFDWLNKKNNIESSPPQKPQFIELKEIDITEDPVRPELTLKWRTSFNRKIFGLQYNDVQEPVAFVCLAFTNEVPHTVRELDLMSKLSVYEDNATIAIAYTVWSLQKGAGKKIMKEVLHYAKTKGFQRLVTLSPLTPMATHYHIRNNAKLIGFNTYTQNFEYNLEELGG